jgi:stage III sporulation protein AF
MEGLTGWLKHVIAVVLLAGLVDLLLPNRTMQRYVRLVAGLFIMLAVASPILKWIQDDLGGKLSEELGGAYFRKQEASASSELARTLEAGRKWQERQREEAASVAAAKLAATIRADLEQTESRGVNDVRVGVGWRSDGTLDIREVVVELGADAASAGGRRTSPAPAAQVKPVTVEPVKAVEIGEPSPPASAEEQTEAAAAPNAEPADAQPSGVQPAGVQPADPRTASRIASQIAARYGVPAERVSVVSAPSASAAISAMSGANGPSADDRRR